jgi:hypothetical protein
MIHYFCSNDLHENRWANAHGEDESTLPSDGMIGVKRHHAAYIIQKNVRQWLRRRRKRWWRQRQMYNSFHIILSLDNTIHLLTLILKGAHQSFIAAYQTSSVSLLCHLDLLDSI